MDFGLCGRGSSLCDGTQGSKLGRAGWEKTKMRLQWFKNETRILNLVFHVSLHVDFSLWGTRLWLRVLALGSEFLDRKILEYYDK